MKTRDVSEYRGTVKVETVPAERHAVEIRAQKEIRRSIDAGLKPEDSPMVRAKKVLRAYVAADELARQVADGTSYNELMDILGHPPKEK